MGGAAAGAVGGSRIDINQLYPCLSFVRLSASLVPPDRGRAGTTWVSQCAPRRVEVLMQPDLFWAIILGGCLIALAFIAIPNNFGVLKDRDDDSAHATPALGLAPL